MLVPGQHLNQSSVDASVSQLGNKLSTPTVTAGAIYACYFIQPLKQVDDGLSRKPSTLGAEQQCC